jgi:hypothetical protein
MDLSFHPIRRTSGVWHEVARCGGWHHERFPIPEFAAARRRWDAFNDGQQEVQAGANARAGDVVSVSLQLDQEERKVIVPQELETELLEDKQAASVFAALPYSHKKEYVDWISTAKQPSTKASRVTKAVSMLAAGKRRLR